MGTLRLIGRGLSDSLEHLLLFAVLTFAWWAAVLLVVPGPGATVALFAMTDPRRAIDPPEWREGVEVGWRNLRRGWALALLTLPLPAVLLWNLGFYAADTGRLGWLVPAWVLMLGLFLAMGAYAFSVSALTDAPVREALKVGAILVATRPGRAVVIAAICWLLIALGTLLVVPLVMLVPAMVAAIVNRVVAAGLGLTVVDPLAPTAERVHEEQARLGRRSRFGP